MENSPLDEHRRAFQLRQRGLQGTHNPPLQVSSEQVNGGVNPTASSITRLDAGEQTGAVNYSNNNNSSPPCGDGNHSGVEDNEFESFHRSFTIGANLLDSLANRPGSFGGSPAEENGGLESMTPLTSSGGPGGMGPQETFSSELSQLHEDPTVVQARKSMMARTGDRHARGKLPEPKEGRFLSPDALPVEPLIPTTRSSKRYIKERRRLPDVVEGQSENGAAMQEDEHVVICRRCQTDLRVKKAAFAVLCKSCGELNPASSGNRSHQSRFATPNR
jgi:hypothetical protein